MKKEYISPFANVVNIQSESPIMQASSPSFSVDNSQETDVVLSNKSENGYWNEATWSETDSEE